jgi:peroxiredoxin
MKKIVGLIALVAVAAGFILAPRLSHKNKMASNTSSPTAAGLNVGDTAPDFNLKNVDGKMVSLATVPAVAGVQTEGYIVTFTCNTCPYAVMYEDRIIELHKKLAPQGWPVVAIQPNDPDVKPGDGFEEMKVRAKEKEFPFVYLFDEGQKVFPQYGATKTPHVYVLDKNRKVRYIGAIDNNAQDADAVTQRYVENAVAAIKTGKEPDPNFTKAVGCGIKSK